MGDRIVRFAERYGVLLLRVALGIVFVWFGALKIFGVSPAAYIVAQTLFFLPPNVAVLSMGIVELVIGIGLISGLGLPFILILFYLQMFGTFVTMLVRPEFVFRGNPFVLTTLGEFIIKNFVFLAAGLILIAARRTGKT